MSKWCSGSSWVLFLDIVMQLLWWWRSTFKEPKWNEGLIPWTEFKVDKTPSVIFQNPNKSNLFSATGKQHSDARWDRQGMHLRTPGHGGLDDYGQYLVFIIGMVGIYSKFLILNSNSRFCVLKSGWMGRVEIDQLKG